MSKYLKLIVPLTLTLAILVSCGSETEVQNNSDSESAESSNGYHVEVENYGRNLTLTEKPTKVLTLGPNCTELFVELGLGDLVIGRSLVNHSRGPLEELADEVNAIPYINYAEATREGILTSGAEFIYAIDWEISEVGCNIDEVESLGMNVYVNSASTLEELFKEIEDIGKIFEVEDRASAFINEQKERLGIVSEKLEGVEQVKVLVYDSGNDGVFTASGSNFESVLIKEAGGENIFSDITDKQWITVSYEEILERNPDIIVIHDYDNITYEDKIVEIKANPVLSELECVKNDRFVKAELESVLPGNRVALTVENFATNFHPQEMAN